MIIQLKQNTLTLYVQQVWGRCGCDRMVVGFTITIKVVSLNPFHGEVYLIQHYVIKLVSDLQQICGFLQVSSTNKTDCHDITEILLKVPLNTIYQTVQQVYSDLIF